MSLIGSSGLRMPYSATMAEIRQRIGQHLLERVDSSDAGLEREI